MAKSKIRAADLFCGAGGTSTGLFNACEAAGRAVDLVAVNHWERAVETHAANHPRSAHFCQSLADLDPRKAVPGGKLDLLVASPECTHHSVARGGKPANDQSRASAWCILRWATALRIDRILVENVPEFLTWGPLGVDGRPLKSKRGETFLAFVGSLESLGYRVEWRVLNAADFGAATSRRRLFIQAAKGRREIRWPTPTHAANPRAGFFADALPRWRAAREVIDWTIRGTSIFGRKRPLSANTLKRIEAGLRKFGGAAAEPFLVLLRGTDQKQVQGSAKSLDQPTPPVTCSGAHLGLCEPFIVPTNYGERAGQAPRCHDIGRPVPTVVAGGATHALVEPFTLPHRMFEKMQVDDVDDPLRTITATNGGNSALVEPFLVPFYQNGEADPVSDPLRTVTTRDRFGLASVDGLRLDILFRMLQPHELAAAMGFPAGYRITGNRSEQVKQIGNAVEVNQARALVAEMLDVA